MQTATTVKASEDTFPAEISSDNISFAMTRPDVIRKWRLAHVAVNMAPAVPEKRLPH